MLATADLGTLGLPRARISAIQEFARAVDREAIPLDRSVPLDQLVQALTAIRGLGPWTAHYIALRLGERDAFPADDLGLRRAIKNLNPQGTTALNELGARWSPWRATAAIHLWTAQRAPQSAAQSAGTVSTAS